VFLEFVSKMSPVLLMDPLVASANRPRIRPGIGSRAVEISLRVGVGVNSALQCGGVNSACSLMPESRLDPPRPPAPPAAAAGEDWEPTRERFGVRPGVTPPCDRSWAALAMAPRLVERHFLTTFQEGCASHKANQ